MVKLSELKNDEIIMVHDIAMSKEEFLDSSYYLDREEECPTVYTTKSIILNFDIRSYIESVSEEGFDDYYELFNNAISSEKLNEIDELLNNASKTLPVYYPREKINIEE